MGDFLNSKLTKRRDGRSGGYKEMSSIIVDQKSPVIRVQIRGEGGSCGSCGVSANEYSCAHHAMEPNKLWRSTSIFNLCRR
jgi:hypothetical protein